MNLPLRGDIKILHSSITKIGVGKLILKVRREVTKRHFDQQFVVLGYHGMYRDRAQSLL